MARHPAAPRRWWNVRTPWLILAVGYLWFFALAFWVHDMPTIARKARTVLALYALDATCLVVFGGMLSWR